MDEQRIEKIEEQLGMLSQILNDIPSQTAEAVKANQKRTKKEEKQDDLMHMMLQSMIDTFTKSKQEELLEHFYPQIDKRIKERYGFLPEVHEIKIGPVTSKITGITHEKFDEILSVVNSNLPVYLVGPAGTGKNVICKQIADSLGLNFYFTNAVTQEYKLTGFIDANGTYQDTQFFKAFTEGGLFFLDEMDGSIPEVLIILNAAIANGYFDFPVGKREAHPDFHVIAAGNTVGSGADNEYTGRYCLDRASLDRFVTIKVDYSQKIEKAMADGNEELLEFVKSFRNACNDSGIDCLFSYRSIDRINKLEKVIDNLTEVLNISLLKGMNKDDLNILVDRFTRYDINNKYIKCIVDGGFENF